MGIIQRYMAKKRYEKENALWIAQERMKRLKEKRRILEAQAAVKKERRTQRDMKLAPYKDALNKLRKTTKKKGRKKKSGSAQRLINKQKGTTNHDHLKLQQGGGVMGTDVSNPEWLQ